MHTSRCPKCGSEEVLDYTDVNSLIGNNEKPMFCPDCRTIGSKEQFSKNPHPWNWKYWRIKLIPLLLSVGIFVLLPVSLTVRAIASFIVYFLLSSIKWKRADGRKAFPPYLW